MSPIVTSTADSPPVAEISMFVDISVLHNEPMPCRFWHLGPEILPITLALVYAGTTLKDLSDISHGWREISPSRWVRASA
ncbi:F-box/LRR-repeat protein 5 [Bienertia sinuspersici]